MTNKMPKHFICREAQSISLMCFDVCKRLKEKYINSDVPYRAVLDALLFNHVKEFDSLLRHPSVQGHLDPSILTPEVEESSTTGAFIKRLKRQMNAVCILAEELNIGAPANANEVEVVTRAKQVVNELYDAIQPTYFSSSS